MLKFYARMGASIFSGAAPAPILFIDGDHRLTSSQGDQLHIRITRCALCNYQLRVARSLGRKGQSEYRALRSDTT